MLLERSLDVDARIQARERAGTLAREKAAAREAFLAQAEAGREDRPITLGRLMSEIKEACTSRTVIVDECWSASSILRETLQPSTPGTFFRARKGGSIGWDSPRPWV